MAEKLASLRKKGGGSKDYGIISATANTNNTVNSSVGYTTNSNKFTVPALDFTRTASMTVKKGGNYHYVILLTSRGTGVSNYIAIGNTQISVTTNPLEGDISIGDNTICTITASCTNNYYGNINLMLIEK